MRVSEWTTELEAVVRADAESVVRWWTDPVRDIEERIAVHNWTVDDLQYEDFQSGSERGYIVSYSVGGRGTVRMRKATPVRDPGDFERTPEGWVLLRNVIRLDRLAAGKRVGFTESQNLVAFIPALATKTRVRLTTTDRKTGGPWWERFLPPHTEWLQVDRELAQKALICESDLGVDMSPPPKEHHTYHPPWTL